MFSLQSLLQALVAANLACADAIIRYAIPWFLIMNYFWIMKYWLELYERLVERV